MCPSKPCVKHILSCQLPPSHQDICLTYSFGCSQFNSSAINGIPTLLKSAVILDFGFLTRLIINRLCFGQQDVLMVVLFDSD